MDPIRDAFQKVKTDLDLLKNQITTLKSELYETRQEMLKICQILSEITEKITKNQQDYVKKTSFDTSTHKSENSAVPTHSSTLRQSLSPPKPQNLGFSTGNEGVPTDRQTDKQTDKFTQKTPIFEQNSIENAAKILDSLDALKKEIRLKFKMLTDQEVLVFSTLYQLEEAQGHVDYRALSIKLGLTESSIRDYIGRLIRKGIPVDKKRINNKQILLSISPNLKKIASLATILQLRDL